MLGVDTIDVTLGDAPVLKGTSLSVADGEIVTVLGPSGSGKTTLLRAVAGLVEIQSGDITWNGESILGLPSHLRRFGLMFQGYALFPHLDVGGNVAFGLRMAEQENIAEEVRRALEWVDLGGFEDRPIDSLSGGEKQRVALARTLAPKPRLVMLDEPLGALDRNLRQRLVVDTRRILDERGVTAVIVTHDRDEASALADRLAIMREGSIVQTGPIDEILANPVDEWVAEFLS
jgi:ABC-type Fe3+/spermidine/putrescine transport system ATPase subunit